jgi:SAUR family protein
MEHLKQPYFLDLLDLAVQEFGYKQQGILHIPCTPEAFRSITGAIRRSKS